MAKSDSSSETSSLTTSESESEYEEEVDLEPTNWTKLKDGWQEFLEDESAFFIPTEDQSKSGDGSQIISSIDDGNKFYDPLGILKIPPRKVNVLKNHLLSLESEEFSPISYLSEVHSQTTFKELSLGMSKLKEALSSKAIEIKFLVKENFEHFVKCKDTVDDLCYDLITGTKMLEDMSGSITKIIDKTSKVYHPLLRGKMDADHIRKVLTLLNKYKVIFKLPGKISENIKNQEFEKVVHNYKNAKTLITSNQKKPFQKILLDIERIIEEFRVQLFTTLREPQSKPDQLKKVIKVLMEIGNGKGEFAMVGDPCWYYLSHKHKAITLLIKQCSEDTTISNHKIIRKLSILLLSNIPNLYKMGRAYIEGKFDTEQQSQKITSKMELEKISGRNGHQRTQSQSGKVKELKTVSVVIHYLDESFSNFRVDKLKKVQDLIDQCKKRFIDTEGETYCLYKLSVKKSKDINRIKLVELSPDDIPYKLQKKWIQKSSNHKFLFKRKDEEYQNASESTHVVQKDLVSSYKQHKKQNSMATASVNEENFKNIVVELLQLYCSRVEKLFFDQTNNLTVTSSNANQDFSANMVENVNEVLKCQEMLHQLGMSDQYLQSVHQLVETLILHFVSQICSEMIAEVSFLYLLEDWVPNEFDDIIITGNQVDGMITTKLLGEFVQTIKKSLDKLSFLSNHQTLLSHVEVSLCEAIESFGDCLHSLAFQNNKDLELIENILKQYQEEGGDDNLIDTDQKPDTNNKATSQKSNVNSSQKLLLTLSNCSTVVSKTAVQLRGYYFTMFHQTCNIKKVIEKLGVLERLILEKYVQEKNVVLGEILTRGIMNNQWITSSTTQLPTKVNAYVLSILTKLVFIHNEIIQTINSLDIASAIITRIYEFILMSLKFTYSQIDPLFISTSGKFQIFLDVLFLENILDSYNNEKILKLSQLFKKDLNSNMSFSNASTKSPYQSSQSSNQFNTSTASKLLDQTLQKNLEKSYLLFSCFKLN
ncbi:exocyst complex subunit 2 [Tieghemostelium lacteum]|uniref:Exocyst complex component 2 n=1 Tax=Tieghemostelium lacteum TaxID=361077 RepID=A0A151Z6Z5_TIELA|nr:exocyst complex subunit 2 [Tieghemostelium lacteum]|eukprot:KYQ89708.1 exocyst complex subunit 2 [Tieghemostelium lacteum]